MNLPKHVKKFIEDNITKIESEDWMAVLEAWFTAADGNKHVYNLEALTEFSHVLKQAGIDFIKETENIRLIFMINKITEAFRNEIATWQDCFDYWVKDGTLDKEKNESMFDTIEFSEIKMYLHSTLFYTKDQLISMCNDVARELGYKVEYPGHYVRGVDNNDNIC